MLSPKAQRVVNAIDKLVDAAVAESTRDDPDSLGTYYEKKELEEAFEDFLTKLESPMPDHNHLYEFVKWLGDPWEKVRQALLECECGKQITQWRSI